MKQITEDYCSFEIAKLLKEKGFEQIGCEKRYNLQGDLVSGFAYGPVAPTQSLALKWLREVHNIVIVIEPYDSWEDARFEFTIYKRHDNDTFEWDMIDVLNSLHKGYETCIDAAVKYTLENLI